jgi:hypothetical protein
MVPVTALQILQSDQEQGDEEARRADKEAGGNTEAGLIKDGWRSSNGDARFAQS